MAMISRQPILIKGLKWSTSHWFHDHFTPILNLELTTSKTSTASSGPFYWILCLPFYLKFKGVKWFLDGLFLTSQEFRVKWSDHFSPPTWAKMVSE